MNQLCIYSIAHQAIEAHANEGNPWEPKQNMRETKQKREREKKSARKKESERKK